MKINLQAPKYPYLRVPKPPKWLIVSVRGDNLNYFKLNKFLQRKVGTIECGDISRFGRNSVLVRARSASQSHMLSHLKTADSDIQVDVKPHMNFSYGRGVVFNRDLYDFTEDEILCMSPESVWKVQKIPRTSMVVITFKDSIVPTHLYIENERIPIRPFKQRPLQCYNCFKFGHPSKVCKNVKLCGNCSAPEHGECKYNAKCVNCNSDHYSSDKKCPQYQIEEAALQKSNAEHISVGYARRLLNKAKSYAGALKSNNDTVPVNNQLPKFSTKNSTSLVNSDEASSLSQFINPVPINVGTPPTSKTPFLSFIREIALGCHLRK